MVLFGTIIYYINVLQCFNTKGYVCKCIIKPSGRRLCVLPIQIVLLTVCEPQQEQVVMIISVRCTGVLER